MRIGANWPYDAMPTAPSETYRRFGLLGPPEEVLIMSHAAIQDYQSIAGIWPGLTWHIRAKTGIPNRGEWPANPLDWTEWLGTRSVADALEWCLANGIEPKLILGNEPDIELARVPVDDPGNRSQAISFYLGWADRFISKIRERYQHRVLVALAPLSQGNPERFTQWWGNYGVSGLLTRCDFVAEHCYTFGPKYPYDDPDRGGRFLHLDTGGLPLEITEANDNGALQPGSAEAMDHLAGYVSWVASTGKAESLSLFTLPGGQVDAEKPAWWFLSDNLLSAAGKAARTPVAPPEEPEAPPDDDVPMANDPRGQVIRIAVDAADAARIPRELVLACAIAESDLVPTARRPRNPADDARYWPDVSMGAWQQTVRWTEEYAAWAKAHGHNPADVPPAEVIRTIGDRFYDPSYAASIAVPNLAAKWRSYQPDILETLCRYNWPAQRGIDNPNRANYARALLEAVQILGQDIPGEPAEPQAPALVFSPDYPNIRQPSEWTCSATATAWLLGAVGLPQTVQWVVEQLGPAGINPDVGLTDGSGAGLVGVLKSVGLDAHNGRLTFDRAKAVAEAGIPLIVGGMGWYHWAGIRRVNGAGNLQVANPAGSYMGVSDELGPNGYAALGPFYGVWVDLATSEARQDKPVPPVQPPPPAQTEVERLRAQVATLQATVNSLVSRLGYVAGDVATALEDSVVKAKNVKRADLRREAQNVVNALRAQDPSKL